MNTATIHRVTSAAHGVLTVLKAAEAGGLPIPDQVQIMDLHTTATLTFYVRSLDDLTAWAMWLDETISETVIGARVHHRVDGVMFDQPLRVLAFTKVGS